MRAFCSTSNTDIPCLFNSRIVSKICTTICGARPSEGSSSSSNLGRAMRARAMASICCWPPESRPPACDLRSFKIGNMANIFSMSSAIPALSVRVNAPICRFSSTLSRGNILRPSGEWARPQDTISWAFMRAISRPSNSMRPLRVFTTPEMHMRDVVFPAPFAPMRATISPAFTKREISCSTSMGPYPARSFSTFNSSISSPLPCRGRLR